MDMFHEIAEESHCADAIVPWWREALLLHVGNLKLLGGDSPVSYEQNKQCKNDTIWV